MHLCRDPNDVVRAYATAATLPSSSAERVASLAVPWREGEGLTDEEGP